MSTDTSASPSPTTEQATNVLLIVDAETLLTRYPKPSLDPQNPTVIEDGFIFTVGATQGPTPAAKGTCLELAENSAKTFHLRGRTVGLHAEHSVVFYDLSVGDARVLSQPQLVVHNGLTLPAPNPETPTEPVAVKADDHYWHCQQLSTGVEQCELSFMLVNSSCEALGYFSWTVGVKLSG
ncbi:inclusion body family protein [Pseudomonas sp. 6D_7.1_Bac1]|uniref:inclusion body family protein n=1 Tax=Pseudomonas sp. 6D_7.1_Bac1 TaxID=2971615 RepID=UPI0021C7D9DA|nr:inclusion body family protein [Pseudomonas sp. 6D_7.1_Bac1]MCU1750572.1 inclusion body family protein [Pseudomonas sp. 6D_7.1_Bac1]